MKRKSLEAFLIAGIILVFSILTLTVVFANLPFIYIAFFFAISISILILFLGEKEIAVNNGTKKKRMTKKNKSTQIKSNRKRTRFPFFPIFSIFYKRKPSNKLKTENLKSLSEKDDYPALRKSTSTKRPIIVDRAPVLKEVVITGPGAGEEEFALWDQITFEEDIPGVNNNNTEEINKKKPDYPKIPSLPDDNVRGIVERYWLTGGFSYARIIADAIQGTRYEIIEPTVSPRELILLEEVHSYLKDVVVFDVPKKKGTIDLQYDDVSRIIRMYEPSIGEDRARVLYYYLRRNFLGYSRLDPLMHDPNLEDISCNGPLVPVYIFHTRYGSIPTNLSFQKEDLNNFVQKLAQKADKQVSLTSPLIDATLPEGARIQLTYSEVVSPHGSSFTVRKFRSDPITPYDLLELGTYSAELLAFIWLCVENRKSMILVGGTASGKTSTMNAISFFIPAHSKIVSLEDTREIKIPHNNWLPTITRDNPASISQGDVDMYTLLRSSLRQRPEYIIVGEVRGKEAQTLFQAMNTGHTTYSTLHAGTIEEAINRLINEPISVPAAMFGALNLIAIQSINFLNGKIVRRCSSLHEINMEKGGKVGWRTLYQWDPVNDVFNKTFHVSKILESIQYLHGWNSVELGAELERRRYYLEKLLKTSNPERTLQEISSFSLEITDKKTTEVPFKDADSLMNSGEERIQESDKIVQNQLEDLTTSFIINSSQLEKGNKERSSEDDESWDELEDLLIIAAPVMKTPELEHKTEPKKISLQQIVSGTVERDNGEKFLKHQDLPEKKETMSQQINDHEELPTDYIYEYSLPLIASKEKNISLELRGMKF